MTTLCRWCPAITTPRCANEMSDEMAEWRSLVPATATTWRHRMCARVREPKMISSSLFLLPACIHLTCGSSQNIATIKQIALNELAEEIVVRTLLIQPSSFPRRLLVRRRRSLAARNKPLRTFAYGRAGLSVVAIPVTLWRGGFFPATARRVRAGDYCISHRNSKARFRRQAEINLMMSRSNVS